MLKRNKEALKTKKRGQSTIEYIILIAAIIAALIIFLSPGGPFVTAYNDTLTTGTNGMNQTAQRLMSSRGCVRADGNVIQPGQGGAANPGC